MKRGNSSFCAGVRHKSCPAFRRLRDEERHLIQLVKIHLRQQIRWKMEAQTGFCSGGGGRDSHVCCTEAIQQGGGFVLSPAHRCVFVCFREFRMSGGKKRSGFQITSVTSDFKQTPNDQSAPSIVLTAKGSACGLQGSSSQPTTPSLKRRYVSHDAPAQEAGCSRFRVVRLAVSGPGGGGGRGKPYHRGRWTCTEFMEWQEGVGFRRVLDTMRHAHSLESLEMIGRDAGRGGVHSQGATQLPSQPVKIKESSGVGIHSGPPSPTHKEPVHVRLLDCKEPGEEEQLDSSGSSPPGRPRVLPPPLPLAAGTHGQVHTKVSGEESKSQLRL